MDLANKKVEDCFLKTKIVYFTASNNVRVSQHAQLDEPTCKHTQCSNETYSHEDTQQNMVQHHGHKLPLLSSLRGGRKMCD